ncbi:MAG: antibiotic biosynthesis monooxygenase [Verrucomicrobia bacterium]|nr:antibiotic biosynthesis monooxygenase [Verrucomicrobiota bacterium]
MPIHIAISRRVRPGCEAEFQAALREFFRVSFAHSGVWGASMLTPPPGSDSREYGILRTFAGETERDAFYESPMFKAWEERARTLTEGEPVYRQLHGLEAWFRAPRNPPPRWKMAVATLLGVYPVSLLIGVVLSPALRQLPLALNLFVVSAIIVGLLTWVVMPLVARLLHGWLNPQPQTKERNA